MEPNWDEMLANQTKATKQAEQDLAKDKAHTDVLKKIAEQSHQHQHYDNDHHHHQVHHTGESHHHHDGCCIIQ